MPADLILSSELTLIPIAQLGRLDSDRLRELRNDPKIRDSLFNDEEITVKEHENWLRLHREGRRPPYFAAKAGNELVGVIGFSTLDAETKRAQWGFYVAPNHRRKGIATAMWKRFMALAFGQFEVETLCGEVLANNKASIEMHRAFGFRQVNGKKVQQRRNGDHVNILQFELSRGQWSRAKE